MKTEATQIKMSDEQLIADRVRTDAWKKMNSVERALAKLPQQNMPLNHVFTDGLFSRSIFMPAGTVATSRIHLTEHQFVVSLGSVIVWDGEGPAQRLSAPHVGVTKRGTRRMLVVESDCIFTTFHCNPDNETDPDKLVDKLTFDPVELGHLDDLAPDQLAAISANAKPKEL